MEAISRGVENGTGGIWHWLACTMDNSCHYSRALRAVGRRGRQIYGCQDAKADNPWSPKICDIDWNRDKSFTNKCPKQHLQDSNIGSLSMLGRAAVRSLRLCKTPAPIQPAFPSIRSRTYAKNSKPKRPFEYKAPTGPNATNKHGLNAQRPEGPVTSATESHRNSQPAATQPSSDAPADDPAGKSADSEYPELPDEFQTSAPADRPLKPLPDLTKGIPSTLDSEMISSPTHADPKSLNITEAPARAGGQGGGDLPKSAYISSSERRRTNIARNTLIIFALATTVGAVYLGRNWENEEEELAHSDAPSGWGIGLMWNRALARWNSTLDYYNEPAFPKLLPDVDPSQERPYTLVLSLEDMLVHSEWSRQHGWRAAKRPGVDYFLRYLSQYYELVVFTSVPYAIGANIMKQLDPYHVVLPLFREATRYSVKSGEYVKVRPFLLQFNRRLTLL